MRAADTNVVIRYLMNDDAGQALRARRFVDTAEIYIAPTVLLEAEWVLRTAFRLGKPQIAGALRQFINLPTVTMGDPEQAANALHWFEQGMDFADALHLAAARDCDGMATFDRDFIKAAARIGAGNVVEP